MSKEEDECKEAGYISDTYIHGEQPSRFKDRQATATLTMFNTDINVKILRIARYIAPLRKHDRKIPGKVFMELVVLDEDTDAK